MSFPTLTGAALALVERALLKSGDGVVRVELPRHFAIGEFIEAADHAEWRFGLTHPFSSAQTPRRQRITKDPRKITAWRNESISERKQSPLIILGTAAGASEAGLRRAPTVIRENDILREYRSQGTSWFHEGAAIAGPPQLFGALVDMTIEGQLDPIALEEYCQEVFLNRETVHTRPQADLWRLGLLPDPRVMDTRTPGTRLSLNQRTVEFLLSSPDSAVEERQLQRLIAAENNGNQMAGAVRKFANTHDVRHLRQTALDAVLEILQRPSNELTTPDPIPPEPAALSEALDKPFDGLVHELRASTRDWDPAGTTEYNVACDAGGLRIRFRLESAELDEPWLSTDDRSSLWSVRSAGTGLDSATWFSSSHLLEAAAEADALLHTTRFVELASNLLKVRDDVLALERWNEHMLETLLLSPQLLEGAARYIDTWQQLTGAVLSQTETARVAVLRSYLTLLDGDWESASGEAVGEDFQSVELRPLHPFVLLPHVELANYAVTHAGTPGLGTQLEWARDRTVPAYPALWSERTTLVHRRGTARPLFARRGVRQRPESSSRAGVADVIESFLGLHPYAREHLCLLIVDPPAGSGLPSALRAARSSGKIRALTVYVVHTDSDSVDWPSVDARIIDLGRAPSLSEWAGHAVITAHIAFVYQASRAALASSHTGDYRPSRGLQNVLTVSVALPRITADVQNRSHRIPFVSVQPRDANDVVNTFMQLARATEREDRFFQVEPMLQASDAEDIVALGQLCDWLVVATPSPIGMIPPRRLPNDSLVYLGREDSGAYAFFVYGRDLFAVRRHVQRQLIDAPVQPHHDLLEQQIEKLAMSVPNGVLRIGRGKGDVTAQVGLMTASALSRETD